MGKISILIPVYNEVKYIEKCILEVTKYCEGKFDFEIIISDNNSNDGTKSVLEKINDKNIKVLFQDTNLGKGSNLLNCSNHLSCILVMFV